MKKIFRVCIALLLCFSLVTPAFALDGIWHNPYGIDDLYDHEPTEIYPLTPIAGEMIYIKSTTWPIEPGQSVWLTYTKNGEPQQDVGAEWKYNDGNNSYWEAAIGPFAQGDVIEYTVYADKDGQNTQSIGPFSFHVVEWESAQSVELGSQEEGLVVLNVGQETVDHVTVDIFPSGRETSFRYYDDDGETYDYEDGVYFTQEISAQGTGNTEVKIGAVDGSHNSGLDYYYLAVHGQAATEVTSNGSLPYYDDYNALLAAPGEGWTVGKDVYGDVTYIKAYAASDSNSTYTLEGSSPVDADGQTYEAEYASLFGASTDTQASVNQNHSGYSGAGFVDKLEAAGAGVTFYAKVANAGDYDVTFRYANGDAAERSLSVYVNGAYIGKTIMPSTGHWDTWADCLMQLPLAAGNNIITLKHEDASGDTGYVNLDSCTVPFYPEVITAEAENAALYGTAGTNQDHWNYSGSGFVDGMTSAGAGAEFEITVPKDGSYEASIRYCNGTQATKDLNLYVNGSYIETISFGSIGGNWNEWQELTQTLELDEGRNVVALRYDSSNSGNVNLDKLSVKTEPDATISVPLVDNGGFERDTSQSGAWTEWHPDGQAVAYGVDSGSGTNPPESPYAGDKRVYFYSNSAYQQSIHQGINLPNGTYTVQAWIKVSNTAPDIGRMEVTGYGGDSIYVDMPYAGTGWRLVETDITVTTGYLDIGFYCSSLGGTTVHIDNVKILNK